MMVVDTGDSCHSLYELVIMAMAMEKLANTMAIHANLADRDLALEMCATMDGWALKELNEHVGVEEVEAYFLESYLLPHSILPHKAEPLSAGLKKEIIQCRARKNTSTKTGALEQSSTDTEKYVGAKIWIHKFESTIKTKDYLFEREII